MVIIIRRHPHKCVVSVRIQHHYVGLNHYMLGHTLTKWVVISRYNLTTNRIHPHKVDGHYQDAV